MKIYDLIGIGLGPYNLGMAALIQEAGAFDALFFEKEAEFDWHPGMLIDGTDLQVAFLADLVTFANPKSRFTYLNYLHEHQRLYQFFSFKEFEMPRSEYNHYAKWTASLLENCLYERNVISLSDQTSHGYYEVRVLTGTGENETYYAKNISLGTGSKPFLPDAAQKVSGLTHSSDYLHKKEEYKQTDSIAVIGSGQSAAEIFLDLLESQPYHQYHLSWYTRSPGILQLESSKFGQEFFTPDFTDYFHDLPLQQREHALSMLDYVRNGIAPDTLNSIYRWMYHRSSGGRELAITIQPNAELINIKNDGEQLNCTFEHKLSNREFTRSFQRIIAATGYQPNLPSFFQQAFDHAEKENGHFVVSRNYHLLFNKDRHENVYLLTAIEKTHGAEATNMGMAVNRNIHIINKIAGRIIYKNPRNVTFQSFE
ncbi:lysine N(6)-hydroxylase/L-ornithine N(5)-oxygenase family protein [Jeotgalibacillus haloalkalitolerans]|uniref:L-lysine N6-monooxygenase MbtG n=1 Tax=Jeotgalibacillus haloalkalitolerans TaxID=3104292 RepID=A0ABU5KNZ1_9BACL|nr:SidA/IucD/PvdA family monooxygenase [Jeotgalibacillus sp. HH7-29]MDZ5712968.1 SidA/IucD/PvdA family monooxygenase [Jeotgalibacillus sp. HH7-29]